MEVGLEGGSRWFKQGLEVGCKEEVILEFWVQGCGAKLGSKFGGQDGLGWVMWWLGVVEFG